MITNTSEPNETNASSACRYQGRRADWPVLRDRLRVPAAERRRFGYRRLYVFPRREGYRVNLKRV